MKKDNIIIRIMFLFLAVSGIDTLNVGTYGTIGIFSELCFYPFCIGIAILAIRYMLLNQPISIYNSKPLFLSLLGLLFIGIISTFLNIENIVGIEVKGHSAEMRAISNVYIILYDMALCYFLIYALQQVEKPIHFIYHGLKYSAVFIVGYGFVQIAVMMGNEFAFQLMQYVSVIFTSNAGNIQIEELWRINSFRQESSDLGVYLAAIFPWICLGKFYMDKSLSVNVLLVAMLVITFFSNSRLAYVVIGIELIAIWFVVNHNLPMKKQAAHYVMLGIFALLGAYYFDEYLTDIMEVFLSLQDGGGRSTSNITRYGMQMAAWNAFLENPLFGVGLGQFKIVATEYLPSWSYASPEIVELVDINSGLFYGAWNTHVRIAAEFGILGLFVWLYMLGHTIWNYLRVYRVSIGNDRKIVALILISFGGSLLALINFDSLTSVYFWLLICVSVVLQRKRDSRNE